MCMHNYNRYYRSKIHAAFNIKNKSPREKFTAFTKFSLRQSTGISTRAVFVTINAYTSAESVCAFSLSNGDPIAAPAKKGSLFFRAARAQKGKLCLSEERKKKREGSPLSKNLNIIRQFLIEIHHMF